MEMETWGMMGTLLPRRESRAIIEDDPSPEMRRDPHPHYLMRTTDRDIGTIHTMLAMNLSTRTTMYPEDGRRLGYETYADPR